MIPVAPITVHLRAIGRAQGRVEKGRQEKGGKGEQHIGEAHQHPVDPAARVGADDADDRAQPAEMNVTSVATSIAVRAPARIRLKNRGRARLCRTSSRVRRPRIR